MFIIKYTNRFKKDLRKCQKRNLDISKLLAAVKLLEQTGTLPSKYKPHRLIGDREEQWECHLSPDWLLVWEKNESEMILLFLQTGTHSDLFK